jgi:hypothetical protein
MREESGFSAFIRSSKCAKWIAIIKLLLSIVTSITLIMLAIISPSALATIRKSLSSENSSSVRKSLNFSIEKRPCTL